MRDRTISFEDPDADDESDRTRYLNADAVTYLRNVEMTTTWVTKGLYLLVLGVGVYLYFSFVWWLAVAGTVGLLIVLTLLLPWPPLGATIGSLTRSYDFDWSEKQDVLYQFEQATVEYINYEDRRPGVFFNTTYDYYFVPEQIDGMAYRAKSNRPRFLAVCALTLVALAVVVRFGLLPEGGVVPALLAVYAAFLWWRDPQDAVRLDFQSGRSKSFETTPATAEEMIADFRDHGDADRIFTVERAPLSERPLLERVRARILDERPLTYHFNLTNLALVSGTKRSLRYGCYLLAGVVGLLITWLVSTVASLPVSILAGVAVAGGLLIRIRRSDRAVIRTVAGRYPFRRSSITPLVDRFAEQVSDPVQVEGAVTSPLIRTSYNHYFVPENVVTLRRTRSLWAALKAALIGLAALAVVIGLNSVTVPGPDLLPDAITVLCVGVVVWALVQVVSDLLIEGVSVTFRDGSRERYTLSREDVSSLVDSFRAATNAISVDLSGPLVGGATQHVNLATIARLTAVDGEIRTFGWVLVAAAGILAGIGTYALSILLESLLGFGSPALVLGVVAGVLTTAGLWLTLRPERRVHVDTASGNELHLESIDGDAFRRAMEDAESDDFALQGRLPSPLVDRTYQYHFLADNIVSLAHEKRDARLSPLIRGGIVLFTGLVCGVGVLVLLTVFRRHDPPDAVLFPGTLLWLIVFFVAVGKLAGLFEWQVSDLTIELPDGSTQVETLSPSDAGAIVYRFRNRESSRSERDTDSAPTATLGTYLATAIALGTPLLLVLMTTTPIVSHALPMVCDPAVEMHAERVEEPPASAEVVFGEGNRTDIDLFIHPAIEHGTLRRCTVERAVEFKNWMGWYDIEQQDTFYYYRRGEWYRIDSRIETDVPSYL